MNKIGNKSVLAVDKFMPEMHLRLPELTDNAWWSFKKNKERVQKFKETRDSRYIYQNKLDKLCFQHDMAYGDFNHLTKRSASDNVLPYKVFDIAKNPKHDRDKKGLASMVYKLFAIKTSGSC